MKTMIYILYGEDESRQEYKLETIRKNSTYDSMERVNAKNLTRDGLISLLGSMSLFMETTLVVIEEATFLSAKNTTSISANDILNTEMEDKILVLMVPSKKPDSRKKDVKALMAKATCIECKPLDEKGLPSAVQELLNEKKMKMDNKTLNWFCAHCGMDLLQISRELDKISLCSANPDLETVQGLLTIEPTTNVFKMTDALFSRRWMDLLELYHSFRSMNMEPVAINALLASQIRFIFQVRVCMDMGLNQAQIAEKLHASSGRIWNSMKNANRFSASQLLEALSLLSDLDQNLKSGVQNMDEGFENFIFSMLAKEQGYSMNAASF